MFTTIREKQQQWCGAQTETQRALLFPILSAELTMGLCENLRTPGQYNLHVSSKWADGVKGQVNSWITFQNQFENIYLCCGHAGNKVNFVKDVMFSSDRNNERGFLTPHCRGMCIVPACFAAICCHGEAAGA